jgi:acyl dehydratase
MALDYDKLFTLKREISQTYTSPVYPGESLTTEIWRATPGRANFRALVAARGTVVLNNGYAEFECEGK